MQPSGVITITTDFGHKGPFAGVMKGMIIGRFPQATIIDLAHDIPAQWPPEAGFWVSRAYRYFPEGTVHVTMRCGFATTTSVHALPPTVTSTTVASSPRLVPVTLMRTPPFDGLE